MSAYVPSELSTKFDDWLSDKGRVKKRVIAALVHRVMGMSADEVDQLLADHSTGRAPKKPRR